MWSLVLEEIDQLSVAPQYNATYILYLAPMHVTRPDRRRENDADLLRRIWLLNTNITCYVYACRLLCRTSQARMPFLACCCCGPRGDIECLVSPSIDLEIPSFA